MYDFHKLMFSVLTAVTFRFLARIDRVKLKYHAMDKVEK